MPNLLPINIKRILSAVLIFVANALYAQTPKLDSLYHALDYNNKSNKIAVDLNIAIAHEYLYLQIDSIEAHANKALKLANTISYKAGVADANKYLSIAYAMRSDNMNAENYAKKALAIYVEMRDFKGESSCLNNLALIYDASGRFADAIKYHKLSLNIRLARADQVDIAASYNNLGNAYMRVGDYKDALENHLKAMVIREQMHDSAGLADCYINLGGILSAVGNYTESMVYTKKGYMLCKELGNWIGVIDACINIGALEEDLNNMASAMAYYRRALSLSIKHGFKSTYALCYYNIGEVYNSQGNIDSAFNSYKQSLFYATNNNDINSIALAKFGLGKIALSRNQNSLALTYLNDAYSVAHETVDKVKMIDIAKLLGTAYTRLADYKNANKYLTIYASLKDSVNRAELSKELYQNEFKNELALKQNEISLLEKDKALQDQREDFQIFVTISLLALMIGMGLFIGMQYKANKSISKDRLVIRNQKDILENQAKRLEELNSLKDKTFSVLSHDIRGPISSLISIIELMDLGLVSNEEFSQLHGKFSQQLKSVNLMLDNLLHWSKGNISGRSDVRLSQVNIAKVVNANFELYKQITAEKEIKLISYLDKDSKVFADADHVDIIMRNLISNAVKFSNKGGEIVISEEIINDNRIIYVMDNGVGMTNELMSQLFADKPVQPQYGTGGEKGTGIGLLLTKEFVERNHGKIEVRAKEGQGTTFVVTLPLS